MLSTMTQLYITILKTFMKLTWKNQREIFVSLSVSCKKICYQNIINFYDNIHIWFVLPLEGKTAFVQRGFNLVLEHEF